MAGSKFEKKVMPEGADVGLNSGAVIGLGQQHAGREGAQGVAKAQALRAQTRTRHLGAQHI